MTYVKTLLVINKVNLLIWLPSLRTCMNGKTDKYISLEKRKQRKKKSLKVQGWMLLTISSKGKKSGQSDEQMKHSKKCLWADETFKEKNVVILVVIFIVFNQYCRGLRPKVNHFFIYSTDFDVINRKLIWGSLSNYLYIL